MLTVFAEKIRLCIPKGVYDSEKVISNYFEISIYLEIQNASSSPYIDYQLLVDTVYKTSKLNFNLLEEWSELIQKELKMLNISGKLTLVINKLNPAFENYSVGMVGIKLENIL